MSPRSTKVILLSIILVQARTPGQGIRDTSLMLLEAAENAIREDEDEFRTADRIDAFLLQAEEPLDLNRSSQAEIATLPGMDPLLAAAIAEEASRSPFRSLDDVLRVPGMTREVQDRIRPFVRIRHHALLGQSGETMRVQLRTRYGMDLQHRKGYRDGTFRGNGLRALNRFTATGSMGKIPGMEDAFLLHAGLLTEKDAGEARFNDFAGGFLFVEEVGGAWKVGVGDFEAGSGEGMVFSMGRRYGSGADAVGGLKPPRQGIIPHRSPREDGFFRGGSLTTQFDKFSFSILASRLSLNGRLSPGGSLITFDESGIFRTSSEEALRHVSSESVIGGMMEVESFAPFSFGVSGYALRFDHPLAEHLLPGAHGRWFQMAGVHSRYVGESATATFEAAFSTRALGGYSGTIYFRPMQSLDLGVALRSYEPGFATPHGTLFGGETRSEGESGIFSAIRLRALDGLQMWGSLDRTYHDAVSGESVFRSIGKRMAAGARIKMSRRVHLELLWRASALPAHSEGIDAQGRTLALWGDDVREAVRGTLDYEVGSVRWRSRIDATSARPAGAASSAKGVLVSQQLNASLGSFLSVEVRVTVFEAESFDARLFHFEGDVPGTFSNVILTGKGTRWYVVARGTPAPGIGVAFKYAAVRKEESRSLYSGPDEIDGGLDNRLTFQLDVAY